MLDFADFVPKKGTTEKAIELCKLVEPIAARNGCHVALTGGSLYKEGDRKDIDILFYRIRQEPLINKTKLFLDLMDIGLLEMSGFGWCHKAKWNGIEVDMFFPEEDGGDYKPE